MGRILIFCTMFLAFACAQSEDIEETQTLAERPKRVTYCGTYVREAGGCVETSSNCMCDVVISSNTWSAARLAFNDSVESGLTSIGNYFRSSQATVLFPNLADPQVEEVRNYLAQGDKYAKEVVRYDIDQATKDTLGVYPYYLFSEKPENLESNPDIVIPLSLSN